MIVFNVECPLDQCGVDENGTINQVFFFFGETIERQKEIFNFFYDSRASHVLSGTYPRGIDRKKKSR